jgi:hypothetical protein
MTSPERVYSCRRAVEYVVARNIPGGIVECGVWRGGSMMAMALTLLELGVADRELWLYDTFSGMTEPNVEDADFRNEPADRLLAHARRDGHLWARSSLEDVRENMASTGYPSNRTRFVEGPVEETIPEHCPREIALLRLDTDWYESTRHELVHLYPRLADAGPLIIDDYGHWQGAKKAVDEYFADRPQLLARIDYTSRITLKV